MNFLKEFQRAVRGIYKDGADLILDQLNTPVRSQTKVESAWHKEMVLYVTYADAFREGRAANFDTLLKRLPQIEELGCTAIHVLPFLESPMADFGFDISDYTSVRAELGGNSAFRAFLQSATRRNMRIFMDLVLNHCSSEHPWFKKASAGDNRYRDFFCVTQEVPNYVRTYSDKHGVWATYQINKKLVPIYVVFPEQAGEIPHYEKLNKTNWYYHTFYPQQPDLNWQNPRVFLKFCKIIAKWTELGLNFRLDAIGFIGKNLPQGVWMDESRTHAIVHSLHCLIKAYRQDTALLCEVSAPTPAVVPYFGKKQRQESELAYNFELMQGIWFALSNANTTSLWPVLKRSRNLLPSWAGWVNFLRNHDELCLEHMPAKVRLRILKAFASRGLTFREGFGIAGRAASFLGKKRLILAYSLLLSLPGSPALIYGDEFSKENDFGEMKRQQLLKKRRGMKDVAPDARDINRGSLSRKEMQQGTKTFRSLKQLITIRRLLAPLFSTVPKKLSSPKEVFGIEYNLKKRKLIVLCNLGKSPQRSRSQLL